MGDISHYSILLLESIHIIQAWSDVPMGEIFISYKREEEDLARRLADALVSRGWTVWWDPKLRAGDSFDDVIQEAIKNAKCVIVLWSVLSTTSEYVKNEARYALSLKKMVPVVIDDTDLPLRFQGLHTIQLQGWNGSSHYPGFQELLQNIEEKLSRSTAPAAGDELPEVVVLRQRLADDLREIEKRYAIQLESLSKDPFINADDKEFHAKGLQLREIEEKLRKVMGENVTAGSKLEKIYKLGTKCVWYLQRDILVEYKRLTEQMVRPLDSQLKKAEADFQAAIQSSSRQTQR